MNLTIMLGPGYPRMRTPALVDLMEGLVGANVRWLEANRAPPLYRSGVVYRREVTENWQDIPTTLRRRFGDCEDLTAWRCAELRRQGIAARPAIKRTGPQLFHALVRLPDHSFEDPSRRLGMKAP